MTPFIEELKESLQLAVSKKHADSGYIHPHDVVSIKERRLFWALDIGSSGAFLVRKADGAIFGIKGYGTPDYRKGIGFMPDIDGFKLLPYRFARGPFRTDMREYVVFKKD